MAGNAILSASAKLMQEFKDGRSGQWDPDYWIHLANGEEEAEVAEEPVEPVDRDWVEQGPRGDAPDVEIIGQPIIEQPDAVDQGGAEYQVA